MLLSSIGSTICCSMRISQAVRRKHPVDNGAINDLEAGRIGCGETDDTGRIAGAPRWFDEKLAEAASFENIEIVEGDCGPVGTAYVEGFICLVHLAKRALAEQR